MRMYAQKFIDKARVHILIEKKTLNGYICGLLVWPDFELTSVEYFCTFIWIMEYEKNVIQVAQLSKLSIFEKDICTF